LKQWICLCLFKVCEDFPWAKYLCITEAGHTHLYPLLGRYRGVPNTML
jgi:hypothetical protein